MNQKLKICHLSSAHPDGDVRIFHKECASLAKVNSDVSLILANTTSRTEKNVSIIGVDSPYKNRKERMTKTVKDVYQKALEVDADIYHLHDPELLKLVKPFKQNGKKVVYDVHEDLPRQILSKHWIAKPLRKLIAELSERYENRVAARCDAIVAATPYIRDRFLKVNPNTVDVNNYPIPEELLIDFDYKKKVGREICYVGGITRNRGVVELVKSLEGTDTRLLLAGTFQENLQPELETLPAWNQVSILGFLGREEVIDVYKRTKIGMVTLHPIPNYVDALPVKLFEYMAAGLPVIASDFPLLKEIVENNNCGICVNPLDPNAIRKAIDYLMNQPNEAEKMGENGQKLVKEQYNWSIEEQKLIELYQKL